MNYKWQWIDSTFGQQGWFTDERKEELKGTPEFANGHWRALSADEVNEFEASVKRLAWEQS